MMNNAEILPLWPDKDLAEFTLTRYVRPDTLARPAMLVVPGGGYHGVCTSTEGTPIAARFYALGFQVFILNYRCNFSLGHPYPQPQQDILRAVKLIRANAAEWSVRPDNIAAVGFSAGGHLVASAGVFFDKVDASAGDAADAFSGRPDAELLCYPVLTFVGPCHIGSIQKLVGPEYEARRAEFSLELRVSETTPPAFMWHTAADELVPYQNTTLYAEALRARGIACEEHIYPNGGHGRQLGYGDDELGHWPEDARLFLQNSCGFKFQRRHAGRTVIATFDDACKSQLDFVAPLMVKYGFSGTIFPSFYNAGGNYETHPEAFMGAAELRRLHRLGFEIGNHTWSHLKMADLTEDAAEEEILNLERMLVTAGLPKPTSFAYPGGPFQGQKIADVLNRLDYKLARMCNDDVAWRPERDDRFKVPAAAITEEVSRERFAEIVSRAEPGAPVVLVYHGVPDVIHPWCNTAPEEFAWQMEYLAEHGFDVCSFRDYDEIG